MENQNQSFSSVGKFTTITLTNTTQLPTPPHVNAVNIPSQTPSIPANNVNNSNNSINHIYTQAPNTNFHEGNSINTQ